MLFLLVWPVHILDCQDGEIPVVSKVTQRESCAGLDGQLIDLCLVYIEGNRHAEEQAALEPVLLDHSGNARVS